jgi:hypothetical protein
MTLDGDTRFALQINPQAYLWAGLPRPAGGPRGQGWAGVTRTVTGAAGADPASGDAERPWAVTVADGDGNLVEVTFLRNSRYLIKPPMWSFEWYADVTEVSRDDSLGILDLKFGEARHYDYDPFGTEPIPLNTNVPEFPDPATARVVTFDTSVLVAGLRPSKFRADDALFISSALAVEIALCRKRPAGWGAGPGNRGGGTWGLSVPVPLDLSTLGAYWDIANSLPSTNIHGLSRIDLLCAATAAVYKAPMYTTRPEAYIGAGHGLKTLKYGRTRNEDAVDGTVPEPPPEWVLRNRAEAAAQGIDLVKLAQSPPDPAPHLRCVIALPPRDRN